MKFSVTIYRDEDGVYIAECPSIPGCVSQGRSEAEAESNIADAIRECLAVRAELGMPSTVTMRQVEVVSECPLFRCFGRKKLFGRLNIWVGSLPATRESYRINEARLRSHSVSS
jgi:predicted RNase H-like HicB family nuclease